MEPMYRDEELITIPYAALIYDEIEEYEEVIADLTREIEKNSNNYVAYNNRGLALAEIGRIEEALSDFTKAIECSPTGPMPYRNRGNIWENRNQAEGAIEDYTSAIAFQTDEAIVWCSLQRFEINE